MWRPVCPTAMVPVDLRKPDEQLIQLIERKCCEHGRVVSVHIRRAQSPLAEVEMATRAEALAVAVHLGGSFLGNVAIIRLIAV